MKDGFLNQCKNCTTGTINKYKKMNPAQVKITQANYREGNREKVIQGNKEYYRKNKSAHNQKMKAYRDDNREKVLLSKKEYRSRNKEKLSRINKQFRDSEHGRKYHREYCRKWYDHDPKRKICHTMSVLVGRTLKGNKRSLSWTKFVDYSPDQLIRHIESKFKPKMSWDNYGEWHLDHIRPIASFDISSYDDDDFKQCWSLKNLQPLWASENMSKGAKWEDSIPQQGGACL